jgi:hypothetical protein
MVHRAIQSFHTVREDGVSEEFVPQGRLFPDDHLYVVRDVTGVLFERADEYDPYVASPKR